MPVYGEERRDSYYRAAEDIGRGLLVREVRYAKWGVRRARAGGDAVGVALNRAKKGDGLWVRVYGAASARVAKK